MKQWFDAAGKRHGVTVLWMPIMKISGFRTQEKNGYTAIQMEIGSKAKQEVRMNEADLSSFKAGDEVNFTDVIQAGDKVNITATSKGKGFAGVVKRHHFAGGPRTHGQSDRERAPGSIGAGTTPGRVIPGKRMAGRMGNVTVTTLKLKVVDVNPHQKTIFVSGAVPGPRQKLVKLQKI